MKLYATNLAEMVLRFYIMMAVIIIAGFTGQWWLAIVGFVVFFAALTGAKLRDAQSKEGGKRIHMSTDDQSRKAM
ncbi:MAG: hypothetical protein CMN32_00340 [Saprospirales bacterium]|nr:hypothetical protein [Saprospirales bacterium]